MPGPRRLSQARRTRPAPCSGSRRCSRHPCSRSVSRCRSKAPTPAASRSSTSSSSRRRSCYGWEAGALLAAIGTLTQLLQHRPAIRVDVQRGRLRRRRRARRPVDHLDRHAEGRRARRGRRHRRLRGLLGQPAADHARRRGPLEAVLRSPRAHEHRRHRHPVRADGVRGADPRRALATIGGALGGAGRAAARHLALPALDVSRAPRDAARADRSVDGPGQSPPLPRAAAARAGRRGRGRSAAEPLPRRPRRLQAYQRPCTATRPATASCRRPRRGCARAARRSASAETSSPCSSPSTTRRRRSTTADVDRRTASRHAARALDEQITVSAGVATFPVQGVGRDELIRLRRQRSLLGEGARQEPRARLPARGRRARRPEEARAGRRPRCAVRGGGEPRERGRRARRLRRRPRRARRPSSRRGSPTRMGLDPDEVELDAPGRQAARRRQARRPGRDPPQARAADGGGAADARAPSAGRLPHAREPRRRSGRRVRAPPSRATGTAPAIRTACTATTSRSARGSSSSPTRSTR